MEVIIKKSFVKDLKSMPIDIQLRVKECIEVLVSSENIENVNLDIKFLKGSNKKTDYLRIRLGQYRIGAELLSPAVILITIGTRGDFYKNFP